MKYVAEQSGTSIDAMGGSLSNLNRKMGDAANGKNGALAGLMGRLGISLRDANGQVVRGIDILPQLADAFQRNTNESTRGRMGMAMFGKSYAEILPLLVEGSQGIDDNLKRFNKIKGVLGPDEIKGAKDLGDSFKDLDLVMKGFQGTIAKELAPVIQPLITQFTAWWVVNKKMVSANVAGMAKDLSAWIKTIDFGKVLTDIGNFFKGMGRFIEMIGGAKNALIGLVVYMNMQTIMAFVGLLGSIWRLNAAFFSFAVSAIPKLLISLGLYTPATTAAAVATTGLATATNAASAAAGGWLTKLTAVLGVLGSIAAAAAPLAVMWGVKKWAEDTSHDEERVGGIQKNMVAPAQSMLSWFGFDKDSEIERRRASNRNGLDGNEETLSTQDRSSLLPGGGFAGARPSLFGAQQQTVGGKFTFDFVNAPAGMRLTEQQTTGKTDVDMNMGYRGFALGLPY